MDRSQLLLRYRSGWLSAIEPDNILDWYSAFQRPSQPLSFVLRNRGYAVWDTSGVCFFSRASFLAFRNSRIVRCPSFPVLYSRCHWCMERNLWNTGTGPVTDMPRAAMLLGIYRLIKKMQKLVHGRAMCSLLYRAMVSRIYRGPPIVNHLS